MDEVPLLVREVLHRQEGLLAHRVDRVGPQGRADPVRPDPFDLPEDGLLLLQELLPEVRVPHVDEPLAEDRAEAHLLHRPCGLVHVEVHVVEARRPALDHLKARELRAPVDVLGLDLRLPRPDRLLEPRLQRHVVRVAPEERHRGVGVRVHEPRDRGLRLPVDHDVRLGPRLLPDRGDSVPLDVDRRGAAVELHVLDQDAHPRASRAAATIASVARAVRSWVRTMSWYVREPRPIPWQ